MIRLGCCAFSFGWLSLHKSLELSKSLGFTCVDVGASGLSSHVNQQVAAAEPTRTGRMLREAAGRYELELSELFVCSVVVNGRGVDTNSPDEKLRGQALEQFRRICACAAEAGFRSVMGVPGRPQEGLGEQGSWDVAADMLAKMVAIARDAGVGFNVEPHVGSVVETPQGALRMAREVPGLRYTLDYAHFTCLGIPQEEVAPLHEFAGHMHGKQARPGFLKCRMEEGEIDFEAIFRDLIRRDWDGVVTMECIGSLSEDYPERGPLFRNVTDTWQPDAPAPGRTSHPVVQTVLLASELDRILQAIA
jgi:sugar phosphate isomerase/epimerase